jgi:hypothetical protein
MKWKLPRSGRPEQRELEDLVSVGPVIGSQLRMIGIHTVAQLARQDPETLYRRLCRKTKTRVDLCVFDVYRAAVEQARNPGLPAEQCLWWYWSRIRKGVEGEDALPPRTARR